MNKKYIKQALQIIKDIRPYRFLEHLESKFKDQLEKTKQDKLNSEISWVTKISSNKNSPENEPFIIKKSEESFVSIYLSNWFGSDSNPKAKKD